LKARAILLVFVRSEKTGAIYPDSNDPGIPDGAGLAFILQWPAPPDKPDAAADRIGAAIEVAIVAGFCGFYHDSEITRKQSPLVLKYRTNSRCQESAL
jgi:hypothetical protein